MTGIEELRAAVNYLSFNEESCNEKFTAQELLNIASAGRLSKYDVFPDQWEKRQLTEAAKDATVPDWIETEEGLKAIYL